MTSPDQENVCINAVSFTLTTSNPGNICGVLQWQMEHLASAKAAFGAGYAQRVTCVE
jgi:hypothetical protein